jgi:ABC-2 type transport system permease protein
MNPTVARLTLRSLLGRARIWLLVPLPVLLVGLALLANARNVSSLDWMNPIARGLGFGVVVPILSLIIGSSVLGAEIDDGTLVHVLTKPVPRSEILIAKLAVGAAVTGVVTGVSMYAVGVIGIDSRYGLGLAVGAAVASVAYCALFVALSVVSRRPVLIGLAYVLLWEGLLTNLLPGTRSLSIEQYALTIASRVGGSDLLEPHVSLSTAVIMAVVVVVAATTVGIQRLRSFTLAGETS